MKRITTAVTIGLLLSLSLTGCNPTGQTQAPGQEQIQKTKDVVKEVEEGNNILGE